MKVKYLKREIDQLTFQPFVVLEVKIPIEPIMDALAESDANMVHAAIGKELLDKTKEAMNR